MPYKISFECSRQLTDDELLVVRERFGELADELATAAVKTNEEGIPSFDDVPEYFYVAPVQEEISA